MPDNSSRYLLNTMNRVEVPFVKVTIGTYTFGVFQKTPAESTSDGVYQTARITYPNFVKSLTVQKINGQVNTYTLTISYPIRPGDDPNFFEKVFSSVSQRRNITFSYGDLNALAYVYKDEEAIITDVKRNFNMRNAVINYTVQAVSSATLGFSGAFNFPAVTAKPSEIIRQVLYSPRYKLTELFYGMADVDAVDRLGLIAVKDAKVKIPAKTGISPLEYIQYLVGLMRPSSESGSVIKRDSVYALTIHDEINGETLGLRDNLSPLDVVSEQLGGPYFKISLISKAQEHPEAYEIDIGYPSNNLVLAFNIDDQENYSLYYDWQGELSAEDYVNRLNMDGEWESTYAPVLSSGNVQFKTREEDKTWWTKITQYPISGSITIKGLLRPATLMSYVRLNVYYFGRKHISTGLYIVTKQVDTINEQGYRTQLFLTKIGGDDEVYA